MIGAFIKGIGQLSDPAIRRVGRLAMGAAMVVAVGLWISAWFVLGYTSLFASGWLEGVADATGALLTVLLTWLFFPAVVSGVIGLFLEDVAAAVETRHYPGLPAARSMPLGEVVVGTLKFLGVAVALNVVLLFFLFTGPVFPFVFYGVNGYLFGREYFELVALRRLDPVQARALRKAHQGSVLAAGVVLALLLTVPVANLLAPIVGTAAMVHLFEKWRERDRPQG